MAICHTYRPPDGRLVSAGRKTGIRYLGGGYGYIRTGHPCPVINVSPPSLVATQAFHPGTLACLAVPAACHSTPVDAEQVDLASSNERFLDLVLDAIALALQGVDLANDLLALIEQSVQVVVLVGHDGSPTSLC